MTTNRRESRLKSVVIASAIMLAASVAPAAAGSITVNIKKVSSLKPYIIKGTAYVYGPNGYYRTYSFNRCGLPGWGTCPSQYTKKWTDAPNGAYRVRVVFERPPEKNLYNTLDWWESGDSFTFTSNP